MRRRWTLALALALGLALPACAGSPDPVFYALSARKGTPRTSPELTIEMRRTGLPGYLDRPHIVRRSSAERLDLSADERWGAPLDAMVGATLAEDVAERLPSCVVYTEAGSITSPADVRVETDLSRFELAEDGAVRLVAGVAVRWTNSARSATDANAPAPEDPVRVTRHTFSARPASKSTPDQVAALSHVLAQLADAIAASVVQGPPTVPAP